MLYSRSVESMISLVVLVLSLLTAATADCNAQTNIVELLQSPFVSVNDTTDRLLCLLQVYVDRSDPRGVFLTVYSEVTLEMRARIEQGNYFHDNAWVAQYLVDFADMYRQRVVQRETNDPALPAVWRQAFERDANLTLIIQDLVLGMNAHIDYDLSIAIKTVGMTPHFATKYRDHNLVNDVLDVAYRAALTDLATHYDPAFNNITRSVLGPVITVGFEILIRLTRQGAWDNAMSLTALANDPKAYRGYLAVLDAQAVVLGKGALVLNLDKALFAILKLLEGPNQMQSFCCWMPSYCAPTKLSLPAC